MHRISINKNRPDRNVLLEKISSIFELHIKKKLNSYIEMLNDYANKIKSDLVMQYLAVTSTFNQHMIEIFLQKLKGLEAGKPQQDIQLIVNALRYAGCREFNFTDQLLETVKLCFQSAGYQIEKESRECKSRLQQLEKQLNKFRIGKVYEDKRNAIINYNKEKEKFSNKNTSTTASKIKSKGINLNNVIDIEEEEPIKIHDDQEMQQEQIPLTVKINSNITQSKSPSIITFSQTPQPNQPLQTSFEQPNGYKMGRLVASKVKVSQQYTLTVTVENCSTIWIMEQNNRDQVRRLVIYYQSNPERALKSMALYTKVQEIVLFNSQMATKHMLLYYLESFPELKKIELNCHNQFDTDCINKIIITQRNHTFQGIFITPNYHTNMDTLDEKHWYLEQIPRQRTNGHPSEDQVKLLTLFPNIQNIWLSKLNSGYMAKIKELKQLRHLTLGSLANQNIQALDRESWQAISRLTRLVSITFYRLHLQPDFLQYLFIRNKETLATIVLYDCRNLKDHTLGVLKENAVKLKELMLYRCGDPGFKGEDIWLIKTLETLIIRQCPNADSQKAEQLIKHLTVLKHLSLISCPWVSDSLVKQIATLKFLISLNLYNTRITNAVGPHLQTAIQLRNLHVGRTKMKGSGICVISKEKKMLITKLGLRDLGKGIATRSLLQIGYNLPFITHLDIAGCDQLEDSIFDYLTSLKFVSLWNSSISQIKKAELASNGILVFDQNLE